jgi:hypothetical protein
MLLHVSQPAPAPAIIAPAPTHQGDEFPTNRCAPGRHGGQRCTKAAPQTRLYWLQLDNPTTEESMVIDAEIIAGYLPGQGGEVARLQSLVAAEMPGWEIAGLSLADAPDVEF